MTSFGATAGAWLAVIGLTASACSALGQPSGQAATGAAPAGATAAAGGTATGATAAGARSLGVTGTFWVGQRWITFIEPAHTGRTGQRLGPRKLLTQVRYPLAGRPSKAAPATATPPAKGPLPVIVFAPGFMQCGAPYSRLLRAWASAGYVVVVVNFPYSDCTAGTAATEADMVNQPGDMSYVITRMLRLSAAAHGFFSGLLNRHQIAITGQSDGGDTVGAIAASTCCSDHRVVAVAVLSGAEWPPMPGTYFARHPVPMLVTQGSADTINWPGCSVQMYHADPSWARYYLDLFGAGHTIPYWGTNRFERIVARVTTAFFDRYVLGLIAAGPAMKRKGDVPGLAALYSHGGGQLVSGPCDN